MATSPQTPVDDPREPLLGERVTAGGHAERGLGVATATEGDTQGDSKSDTDMGMGLEKMSRRSQWIALAVASGACAAFNGVFAKLTTTELTTTFATSISNLLGLSNLEKGVEVVVRAMFFGLNLIFNGIMWTLFTKALARGTSTTQVSILNTSSNFMITALLGFIIFSEELPPLWWVGAAMLVAGNVIIGAREEGEGDGEGKGDGVEGAEEGEGLLGESMELDLEADLEERKRRQRREEEEDVLQLGLDGEGHAEGLR